MNIKIAGIDFDLFQKVEITRKYDSIGSTFSFNALFEYSNRDHRTMFKPFTYPEVEISQGNTKLLTGYIVNNKFSSSPSKKLSAVSGYSKPGFLEDCDIPQESYPLSFNNLGIREIAEQICAPFDIKVVVDQSVGDLADQVYEQIETDDIKSIKSFLTDLATQRNLLISHTTSGELLITKTNTESVPVANLGSSGQGYEISLSCNGRGMFSDNLMIQDANLDSDNAGEAIIDNPYVKRFRSKTFNQKNGDNNQTEKAARNALSTQLKNISFNIQVVGLFWNNGTLIEPNQIITVQSRDLFLPQITKLFVESVKFSIEGNKITTSVVCVPLEVYNDDQVFSIFD